MNIHNWNTPPSPPFPIPPDLALHNITILSSKFGQDGGVAGLKSLNTTGLQPPWPWLPTNTGENDALQILIESTKLATQPNPPQQPPPQTGSNIRSNLP